MERAVSTKQYVYNQVAQDIITGVYSPDTIITESMLLRKYDVSRVSVREALIELCKERDISCAVEDMGLAHSIKLSFILNALQIGGDITGRNVALAANRTYE